MAFQEMNGGIYEETVEKLLKIRLVSQERAREVLEDRPELNSSELSYAGADENPNNFINTGARPAPAVSRPPTQTMTFGPGPDMDDQDGGLNREQRRRMKKDGKKKKLKI